MGLGGSANVALSLQSQYFPGASTSPYGPVLTLPGTLGSYYSQPTTSAINSQWNTTGFCLEAWVNYASLANSNAYLSSSSYSYMFQRGNSPVSGGDWAIGVLTNGAVSINWTNVGVGNNGVSTPASVVTTGQWTHIMAQGNGSNVYVAVNGVFQTLTGQNYTPTNGNGTLAPTVAPATVIATSSYPLAVGQWGGQTGPNFAIAKARLVFGTTGTNGNVYSSGNFTPSPNFAAVPVGATVAWQLESQYPLPTYPSFFDVPVLPDQISSYGAEPVVVGGVTSNVLGPYATLDSIRFDGTGYIDYGNAASSALTTNLWANAWTIEGWVYPTTYTNSSILNKSPDATFGIDSKGRLNVNNIFTDSLIQGASVLSGTGTDIGYSIATDASGNFYVTGYYSSTGTVPINNLSLSASGTQTASGYVLPAAAGTRDIFILKYNSSGVIQGALVLAGTGGTDIGNSIATDTSGNFYVTGSYSSTGTVPINNLSLSATGTQTASGYVLPITSGGFILKYNSSGVIQGASVMLSIDPRSIATDSSGNFYVTGYNGSNSSINNLSLSASGTQTASGYVLPPPSSSDVFILKYNSSGVIQGALVLAGTGSDAGNSIATDTSGNFYVTGYYNANGYILINNLSLSASGTQTASGYDLPATPTGAQDVFILKYNSSGVIQGALVFSGGGSGYINIGQSIATDASGNFYVTGYYSSAYGVALNNLGLSPAGFAYQWFSGYILPPGSTNAFILKYNSSGVIQGASVLGGTGTDIGYSIATDASGNFYVTGYYSSTGTIPINNLSLSASGTQTASGYVLPPVSYSDVFILKYNSSGVIQGASVLGGTGYDVGYSIVTDASGNFYVTGYYSSTGTVPINNLSLSASGTQMDSGYVLPTAVTNNIFILKYSFTQVPLNTWSHISMIYDGTRSNVYLSGGLITSVVLPALSYIPTTSTQLGNNLLGNLADVRVSNVARYTGSSYTVPTAPFVNDNNTLLLLRSLAGQIGTTLEVQGRGLNSVSLGAGRTIQSFPPAPMSSYLLDTTGNTAVNYGQGKYVASSSNEFSTAYAAYFAFDKSTTTAAGSVSAYTNGVYNGSVTTVDTLGNSYTGEWLQIQLPLSTILSSFTLIGALNGQVKNVKGFTILGSRDGINWTQVYTNSNSGFSTSPAQSLSFQTSATQAYTYYRLVAQTTFATTGNTWELIEWILNGTEESLCITNDAKVGIGIANPQRSLEVAGDLVVGGTISGGAGMGQFRNRIINGDMRIAQRGATSNVSPAAAGSSGSYGSVDRWFTWSRLGSKFSVQQSSVVPLGLGFSNSWLITSLSGYVSVSGDYYGIGQYIEGYNIADLNWGTSYGVPVTLSFWVRSSLVGSYSISLEGGSGFTPSYAVQYTITNSNAWQQIILTIPPPPNGYTANFLNTNGAGVRLWWDLGSFDTTYAVTTPGIWQAGDKIRVAGTTNFLGTNDATMYITGVQLEKGTVATPFEFRPFATELALCQRYYQKSYDLGTNLGTATTTGAVTTSGQNTDQIGGVRFIVSMRTSPRSNIYSTSGTLGKCSTSAGGFDAGGFVSGYINSQNGITYWAVGSGISVGTGYRYQWFADAEL